MFEYTVTIIIFNEKWKKALNNKAFGRAVLMDLLKGFDTKTMTF